MASSPITAWQIEGEKVGVVTDFLFLGSKNISSSVLSFLYSPSCTSMHDYWKNHSFD